MCLNQIIAFLKPGTQHSLISLNLQLLAIIFDVANTSINKIKDEIVRH